MTDVDEMEAGRELDVLIAERVMGWRRAPYTLEGSGLEWADGAGLIPPDARTHITSVQRAPEYSTDIRAAWEVVKKVRAWEPEHRFEFARRLHWAIEDRIGISIGDRNVILYAEPVDICRAALKIQETQNAGALAPSDGPALADTQPTDNEVVHGEALRAPNHQPLVRHVADETQGVNDSKGY
jgi:hypothetical protein